MDANGLKLIGRRINKRRKQLDLTQEQLAERMNVSIQMISNLERGNKAIKIENLIKLCEVLDVSTDYILFGRSGWSEGSSLPEKIKALSSVDQQMIELLVDFCSKKQ